MTPDRPLLGILLMLGFCALAPLGDAMSKVLTATVSIPQLLLVRFAAQALLLGPLVWATGRAWRSDRRTTGLIALRTLLHISGIGMMFSALVYLPLADAIAIAFVMPFIMLVLGALVLGEEVGRRRILACAVGFAGTLLVVQPAFSDVGWPALLPLGVAVNFALFMLVTRQIARRTDPVSLQAVSGAMAVAALAPLFLIAPTALPGFAWHPPGATDWALLAAVGVLGTLAHLLMTWSLRFAPSATLAPMQYLEIPFATLFGWLIFRDLPGPLATLGICITVGAGLYVIAAERASAARRAAPPQSAPIAPLAGSPAPPAPRSGS